MYNAKWKFSRSQAKEFAKKMDEIDAFCAAHGISRSSSGDSYYFAIKGVNYRVSNHTVAASNRGAYDSMGNQIRELYHDSTTDEVQIFASKTRIMEIYSDLEAGFKLNRRGYRI